MSAYSQKRTFAVHQMPLRFGTWMPVVGAVHCIISGLWIPLRLPKRLSSNMQPKTYIVDNCQMC